MCLNCILASLAALSQSSDPEAKILHFGPEPLPDSVVKLFSNPSYIQDAHKDLESATSVEDLYTKLARHTIDTSFTDLLKHTQQWATSVLNDSPDPETYNAAKSAILDALARTHKEIALLMHKISKLEPPALAPETSPISSPDSETSRIRTLNQELSHVQIMTSRSSPLSRTVYFVTLSGKPGVRLHGVMSLDDAASAAKDADAAIEAHIQAQNS